MARNLTDVLESEDQATVENIALNVAYSRVLLNNGQLDNRYYTEAELDAGQLDNRYYTETEIDKFSKLTKVVTLTADSDYTLTADENLYGRLVIEGAVLTVARNIILDNSIAQKVVTNNEGFAITIRNSTGVGVVVNPNQTVTIYNNSVDVVVDNKSIYSALNASGTAPMYTCRAWVNFDGTGTVAIRASGNVSSIADRGVGLFTVNMVTAIEDINYSINTAIQSGAGAIVVMDSLATDPTILETTSFPIRTVAYNNTLVDSSTVCVSVIR